MDKYKEIIAKERELDEALTAFKRDIVAAVEAVRLPDAKEETGGVLRATKVSLRTVMGNGGSLSPRTYIQACQAEAVSRRLEKAHRISDVLERLREMVESGCVKFSDGETVMLNKATIAQLKTFTAEE